MASRRKVGGDQKRSENRALKVYAFGGAPTPTGSASSIAKCYLNVAMSEMRARPVLHGVRLRRWKREGRAQQHQVFCRGGAARPLLGGREFLRQIWEKLPVVWSPPGARLLLPLSRAPSTVYLSLAPTTRTRALALTSPPRRARRLSRSSPRCVPPTRPIATRATPRRAPAPPGSPPRTRSSRTPAATPPRGTRIRTRR